MAYFEDDSGTEITARARVLTEYLTREDVERILKVGKSTVYDLMRTGQLPYSTVGAKRYVRRNDLYQLIEQGFNAPSLMRPAEGQR